MSIPAWNPRLCRVMRGVARIGLVLAVALNVPWAIDGVSAETSYDRRWTFCRVIFPVSSWTSQKANPLQAQASNSVSRE